MKFKNNTIATPLNESLKMIVGHGISFVRSDIDGNLKSIFSAF